MIQVICCAIYTRCIKMSEYTIIQFIIIYWSSLGSTLQCKNKVASHRIGCIVQVFKTNEQCFLHYKGLKNRILGRIKGYLMIRLIFKYYDNHIIPVSASSFRYRSCDRYHISTLWSTLYSRKEVFLTCLAYMI